MSEFSEMIIGGIIGIILTELYEQCLKNCAKKIYKKIILKKRIELYSSERIREKIFNYYEKKHNLEDLHVCKIGTCARTLLYLTKHDWINLNIDVVNCSSIITVNPDDSQHFKINMSMIKKRKFIGQNLFNDETLYLHSVTGNACFVTKKCSFFEKLTFIDSVEKETYIFSKHFSFTRPKIRNKYYSSFESCIRMNRNPTSIGCHVACVITMNGNNYICIEKRSTKTFTYGGYYALLPVFGLVDIPPNVTSYQDNILLYNIVKEYCEEFFSVEELEHLHNRTNPYWFYTQVPQAKMLIDSINDGTTECKYLGFGFDAVNGMGILSCLIYIKDENISKEIYNNNNANWEVDDENLGIEFIKIDDHVLQEYLQDYRYQPASAITIQMALDYINNP